VSEEKEEKKPYKNSFASKPTTPVTPTTSAVERLEASALAIGVQVEFWDQAMGWRPGYTVLGKPDVDGMVQLKSPTGAKLHARRKNVRHAPCAKVA